MQLPVKLQRNVKFSTTHHGPHEKLSQFAITQNSIWLRAPNDIYYYYKLAQMTT